MRSLVAVLLLCTFLAISPALAQKTPAVEADACFNGMSPHGVYPIVVSIKNTASSADGVILVDSASYGENSDRQHYPISLPAGTVKRLIVYPTLSAYMYQVNIAFEGSARIKPAELRIAQEGQRENIGLVGDEVGGLSILRKRGENEDSETQDSMSRFTTLIDCYARPEDAPDRAVGYQGLRALVIASGAERMNAAQWTAIRQWVISGGSLILLGGASAPYLQLPEAQPLVPLQNIRSVFVSRLTLSGGGMNDFTTGRAALLTGALKPGAAALSNEDGNVTLASLPLGAGMVIYAAFNPLEEPIRKEKLRGKLWLGLVRAAAPTLQAAALSPHQEDYGSPYSMPPFRATRPGTPTLMPYAPANDPFRIKMPPVQTILWYFVGYFTLVIPVSYLALRIMRRLQWAWFTGPVVSLAFAYGLYLFTASLYQAGMSRRTQGVLIAAGGSQEARFTGYSEVFLPRAGNYPIKIPGVEILQLRDTENRYSGYSYGRRSSSQQAQPLETVDTGIVESPDFSVGNLAFRRIYHTQGVSLSGAITANLRRGAGGNIAGTIHNGTPYELREISLLAPDKSMRFPASLPPGATLTLPYAAQTNSSVDRSLIRFKEQQAECAFLTASLTGESFGPQFGHYVGGSQSVRLMVSLPLTGGTR